jgi:hypothetical protein
MKVGPLVVCYQRAEATSLRGTCDGLWHNDAVAHTYLNICLCIFDTLPAVLWTCHTAFPADKLGDISKRYYGEEGSAKKPLEVLGNERVSMIGTPLPLIAALSHCVLTHCSC